MRSKSFAVIGKVFTFDIGPFSVNLTELLPLNIFFKTIIEKMIIKLNHRGPDDRGEWIEPNKKSLPAHPKYNGFSPNLSLAKTNFFSL